MERIKVYLAGGLSNNWHEEVIKALQERIEFVFYNPRIHNLLDSEEYTSWDLFHVKRCDILFAYMEANNPSGFGLTLEVGVAHALGKLVILVDEKSKTDQQFAKKFKIVVNASTNYFDNFEDGLKFLESFSRGKIY